MEMRGGWGGRVPIVVSSLYKVNRNDAKCDALLIGKCLPAQKEMTS